MQLKTKPVSESVLVWRGMAEQVMDSSGKQIIIRNAPGRANASPVSAGTHSSTDLSRTPYKDGDSHFA